MEYKFFCVMPVNPDLCLGNEKQYLVTSPDTKVKLISYVNFWQTDQKCPDKEVKIYQCKLDEQEFSDLRGGGTFIYEQAKNTLVKENNSPPILYKNFISK